MARIFRFVGRRGGRIPEDWFKPPAFLLQNRTEGDIDTLAQRIAHIRTWTFVANRPDWLADPLHWQGRTREIEIASLTPCMNGSLSVLSTDGPACSCGGLRQKEELMSTVEEDGAVLVEGELVGKLDGFRFIPAPSTGSDVKGLKAAWAQAIAKEITGRAQTLAAAPDPAFSIDREARIVWHGAPVARLQAGASVLQPRMTLIAERAADRTRARSGGGAAAEVSDAPCRRRARAAREAVAGRGRDRIARGLAFRLVENLGIVAREDVADDVKALSQDDRATLRRYGVKFGAFHIFVPVLLKPGATALRLVLWGLSLEKDGKLDAGALPPTPGPGSPPRSPSTVRRREVSNAPSASASAASGACASTCSSASPT